LLKTKDNNASKQVGHSSIGKRLNKLEVKYFQDIYEDLVLRYNALFSQTESDKFHRFDSTIITLSGKLLKDGLNLGGKAEDRHIKLSIGLKNNIPTSVRICKQVTEASEDIALIKAINQAKVEKEDILLFDRGISKADTYKHMSQANKYFIILLLDLMLAGNIFKSKKTLSPGTKIVV
jgi:transposase